MCSHLLVRVYSVGATLQTPEKKNSSILCCADQAHRYKLLSPLFARVSHKRKNKNEGNDKKRKQKRSVSGERNVSSLQYSRILASHTNRIPKIFFFVSFLFCLCARESCVVVVSRDGGYKMSERGQENRRREKRFWGRSSLGALSSSRLREKRRGSRVTPEELCPTHLFQVDQETCSGSEGFHIQSTIIFFSFLFKQKTKTIKRTKIHKPIFLARSVDQTSFFASRCYPQFHPSIFRFGFLIALGTVCSVSSPHSCSLRAK